MSYSGHNSFRAQGECCLQNDENHDFILFGVVKMAHRAFLSILITHLYKVPSQVWAVKIESYRHSISFHFHKLTKPPQRKMFRFSVFSTALLMFFLLLSSSFAESSTNTAAVLDRDSALDSKELEKSNENGASVDRLSTEHELDEDAGTDSVSEGDDKVEGTVRSGYHYLCPNKCYFGKKAKWLARRDCRRRYSKCYNKRYYKYYKCVVKTCKKKYGYYYKWGWWCTCPY